ncbi:uncharacterized protein CANTADRAFT_20628 [Suhomyces tanzawaensis NRRL Y-17324]|uniref:Uncharacterized protein n=1 Tax=Suhomyces tanzawaensis NRRL Y-17324 TaxID=984487 RepID=A0A1E4SNM0_9ASCO|nr:uncharacterized protein CANTADRAFT_20628 [Suhomyces tanzawaensis NRRL Y-17324]ODV81088.1 hypothetical protein CANTADRAFT_20628 [Suhomyces tanzawaensis NRRL Y-17324]
MSYTNNNSSYPSRHSIGGDISSFRLPSIPHDADGDYPAESPSTTVSPSAHPMSQQLRPLGTSEPNDLYFQYSPSRFYPHQTYQHQPPSHRSSSTTSSPPLAFAAHTANPQYYYYKQGEAQTQPLPQYTHAPNQYLYYQQQQQQHQAHVAYAPQMVQGTPAIHMQHSPMTASGGLSYLPGIAMPGSMPQMHTKRRSKQSTTWSAKEDKLLRELKEVQKLGWREISSFFQDRTPNACQFRWRRIISGTSSGTSTHTTLHHGNPDKKKSHHSINFLLN